MKRLTLYLFLLLPFIVIAATITTITTSGNWNDAGIWALIEIGDTIDEDVDISNNIGSVTIPGGFDYTIGNLDMKNSNTLIIDNGGSLNIGSNQAIRNLIGGNSLTTLNISGYLEIWGDFNVQNDAAIDVSGTMIVHGNFITANIATVNVDGILEINGNIDVGNNSSLTGNGTVNLGGTCTGPTSFCASGPLAVLPPIILNCPTDITISLSGNDCDEVVSWTEPTVVDKGDIVSFTGIHSPGDTFPLDTTLVVYTAINVEGKSSTCSFKIIVTDNTPPIISNCPTDITVSMSSTTTCSEPVMWALPIATDNCQLDTLIGSHIPGDMFPVGTTIVTYTATDLSGNSSECRFNVTVKDNLLPTINNCPKDIVVNLSGNDCDEVVTWPLPLATDNCGILSLTSNYNPGDVFISGTTIVTYTATDLSGNTSTCSFKVVINDSIPPQFDFCPIEVAIAEFDLFEQTAIVTWKEPIASDNCSVPQVTSNFKSGDSFPAGITNVIYTATDNSGNTTTCTFNFEVIGNKVPVARPFTSVATAGKPIKVCLEVKDPDNDDLKIEDIKTDELNGKLEPSEDDQGLCFIYTAFDDFKGRQLLVVSVCDNGQPIACIDVKVAIKVEPDMNLTVNKAFTPNNDNINDVWIIDNIENYPNNQVMVFDRLGGLVFSAKGYDNLSVVWDGLSNQGNNKVLPNGTYFYKIDLGREQPVLKGYIELVR